MGISGIGKLCLDNAITMRDMVSKKKNTSLVTLFNFWFINSYLGMPSFSVTDQARYTEWQSTWAAFWYWPGHWSGKGATIMYS